MEAYQHSHPSFVYAEYIFIIISAGTVYSFIKLFYYVFLRKMPEKYQSIKAEYNSLDTSLLAIALLIILIGLNPTYILTFFITPQLHLTTFDLEFIQKYIVNLQFFAIPDLMTMLIIFALGGIIFVVGTKYHLFHIKLPKWLKIEYLFFFPINAVMRKICLMMYGKECSLHPEEVERLKLKNEKFTFIDRFVYTSKLFNKRYESTIIKSDSLIYTGFITAILIFMLIMSLI